MSLTRRRSDAPEPPVCVALDLESTGLNADADDIIEIAAVRFRGDEVLGSFSTLVNPQRPVTAFIQGLTGITDADIGSAPPFAAIAGDLANFAGAHPIVGHNVGFDLQFLKRKGLRLPGPAYDTFDLATILLPDLHDYSLASVCQALGVTTDRPHRALPDAQMAAAAFEQLVDRLRRLEPAIATEAARIAQRCEWGLRFLLVQVAQEAGTAALQPGEPGLEGVDLEALARRLKTAPASPGRKERSPVALGSMASILGEMGALSKTLDHFESRPEQVQMAEAVARAFAEGGRLIAEAGTGTGKSLAYLAPAALYAYQSGRRVVVSTNTISLQEQIIGKDIPAALAALAAGGVIRDAAEVQFALLKGRANYLCLGRWAALKNGDLPLSVAEAKTLIKVLLWLRTTRTGDRGEVNLTPPEASVWSRLSAQGSEDGAQSCPLSKRGLCFLQAARQRAEGSHVLVVNHALLALDARYGSLLPEYAHLIIDEAHTLEDVATNQWGVEIDDEEINGFLTRIVGGSGPAGAGLLLPFTMAARSTAVAEGRRKDIAALVTQIESDVQALRSHSTALFRLLSDLLEKRSRSAHDYDPRLRLTPAVRADPAWTRVLPAWENVDLAFERVDRGLGRLQTAAQQMPATTPGKAEERALEIDSAAQLGREIREGLASILARPDETMVYWLSTGGQDAALSLHAAPLNVGPALKENLFGAKETSVLTGATLSTEGNFEYVKERLQVEPTSEVLLGSPFDYPSLAMVYVPADMPEPGSPTYQAALNSVIADIARATQGRTLVLFTSRAALRNTRNGLRDDLARKGITVLGQGIDGSPRQLIRAFQSTPNTVLLGTGSFWEGVDISGGALSVLVITRLPFTVPTEPVFAARSQQFPDAFNHYAVPQAVIRFRQGFGRLIRRKTDRGVLVILDRRVSSKRYGAAFLDSIPRCTRKSGPASNVAAEALGWLAQRPLR